MTPQPNTERYEKLASFLQGVMEDTRASRRVRLSAAQRLDDLLRRQERREDAEARRAERQRVQAAKAQQEAIEREIQAKTDPDELAARDAEREQAAERARQNLGKILSNGQ